MRSTRFALITIGTYKEDWWKLSRSKQTEFIARVEEVTRQAGIAPVNGYRLASTPGAFIEVWEGPERAAVDRAVQGLKEMGYTNYIDARWLIGEREMIDSENIQPQRAQSAQRK
jgi:hypothetical protein